jgi:hypothetical protein
MRRETAGDAETDDALASIAKSRLDGCNTSARGAASENLNSGSGGNPAFKGKANCRNHDLCVLHPFSPL